MDINLLECVEDSFAVYAGMTIMKRAIVDARDALKPSNRQCMYAQLLEKITYKKPFRKSNKSVAVSMDHFYIHGDASCYELLVRMAQPYCMRYCLEDFDGQCGTVTNGKAAASRYTEMRLGKLGCTLFDKVEQNTIDEWHWNYDNEEQYPAVVPSFGFYNIVNGSIGIATGLATNIPQFNLNEVNEAMIKLLWNRDTDFDEIYCVPDFCTGGTILNASKVKEIMREGCGGSIRLRSTAEYDEKENCIYFTEIPYGVYVGTILEQLTELINSGELVGIEKINDLSTKKSKLKITLEKNINPNKIIRQLFKKTSLEDTFTINMTMLDKGRFPRVFGWKEALLAHIDHEIDCRVKAYNWQLNKIAFRVNVIDGLFIAIANIDEVVDIIKKSASKADAKEKLKSRFAFDEDQADAILKMPLSRIINIEIQSLKDEKEKLLAEAEKIREILSDNTLLYQQIEDKMREVMKEFGDERRTKVMDLDFTSDDEDAEPIEKKELLLYYTNLGNIHTVESSTLMKTRRGGKGTKIKLASNEAITKIISDDNFSSLLVFSNKGKMYSLSIDELPVNGKVNVAQLFNFEIGEKPTAVVSMSRQKHKYFVFITKNGMIKKTKSEEYNLKRGKSLKAINLKDNDEVVNVLFMDEENVGVLTAGGNFITFVTDNIMPIGRAAAGVKAIKLNEGDYVIDAHAIKDNDKFMITLSKSGLIKKASMADFPTSGRATKGKSISGTKDNDMIIKFLTLEEDFDIIVIVQKKSIKISTSELRLLSRYAAGVKAINLDENDVATGLIRSQE